MELKSTPVRVVSKSNGTRGATINKYDILHEELAPLLKDISSDKSVYITAEELAGYINTDTKHWHSHLVTNMRKKFGLHLTVKKEYDGDKQLAGIYINVANESQKASRAKMGDAISKTKQALKASSNTVIDNNGEQGTRSVQASPQASQ